MTFNWEYAIIQSMKKKRAKFDTKMIIGRDPFCGKTQGRAGPHLTWKNKIKDRKSKIGKRFRRFETDIE